MAQEQTKRTRTSALKPSSRKQQQMAELARGDGMWENIQDVLRAEFVKLWEASAERKQHTKRIEQRLREFEANYAEKADRDSFQQQQAQVEAVARTMNALSEEMCNQEAQKYESEKQLQESLDGLQEELHGELVALESRYVSHADTVKDSCTTLIANVEKRLELLEEELSILVMAIDKKADIERANSDLVAHKKATEEAIRKRCLKVAFDQEVLAIHELLRYQQKTLDTRFDDILTETKSVIDTQVQSKLASISEHYDKKWLESQHDCEQRHVWWVAEQQELLKISQHEQLAHMEDKLQAAAINFNEIAATTKTWVAKVQNELHEAQQRQKDILSRDHGAVRQQMKEELERQMLAWAESVSSNWNELHERVKAGKSKLEVIDQVQSDLTTLKAVTEDLNKDVTTSLDALEQRWQLYSEAKLEELHSQISNEVQQQLVLVDPAMKSKQERKMKQQIQGFGAKLVELDQMIKLVGKQLIQNTSQLQLFRKEQHVRRQLEMADELAMYTQGNLLDNTSEDLNEHVLQSSDNDSSNHRRPVPAATVAKEEMVEAEQIEEDTMLELRSQHQDLKHAVRDKVRHYQKLLQQE